MKILIINGPNINMLGIRESEIYGRETYGDLLEYIKTGAEEIEERKGKNFSLELEFFQSNSEGEIVTAIQEAYGCFDGIVINPAAYTHTSIAILDAIKAVGIPTVEVHISDPDEREDFRRVSFVREACIGTIKGKGFHGYLEALELLIKSVEQ